METLTTEVEAPLVSIELVSQCDQFVALTADWDALLARIPHATCFRRIDWLTTWWQIFGNHNTMQLLLLLLYDQQHTLVGAVPLYIQQYHLGTLRVRIVRWLGQGYGALTDTLGPLLAPGYEHVGMGSALAYLERHRDVWDVLALARTPAIVSNEIATYARTASWRLTLREITGWLAIDLPADWETYQRTLSKNLRSNLPRYRNRLLREERTAHVEMLTEPTEILAVLPQLFILHRLRAQAVDMKRHSDYFAAASSRAFMLLIAAMLSRQQRMALACMRVDGQVVAMQMLLFEGRSMTLYFSGFDPAWSRYSVMLLTTKASLEYAIRQGITWVDLTAGAGSQAKRQWANEEYQTHSLLVAHAPFWGYCCRWGICILHRADAINRSLQKVFGKIAQWKLGKE